jgi:ethanolamine-phosphate cytidylyltransferase
VIPEKERAVLLNACKFVDEVITGTPYEMTEEWVNELITKHGIDYIVHGDDPCITAEGKDAYAYAKKRGVYRQIKRTEGVSTTDIVGRMLLMSKEHHVHSMPLEGETEELVASRNAELLRERSASLTEEKLPASPGGGGGGGDGDAESAATSRKDAAISTFLPTSRRIVQFADGKGPRAGDRVVYMVGGFDLFHTGHVAALRAAKARGDFLLVGIHTDEDLNVRRGGGLPILNLHERTLSVLACKYVAEVIIGAPWKITRDMIKTMGITSVVKGETSDYERVLGHSITSEEGAGDDDPYAVPRELGILDVVRSGSTFTTMDVIARVMEHRAIFEARNAKKGEAEAAYYESSKAYVPEA